MNGGAHAGAEDLDRARRLALRLLGPWGRKAWPSYSGFKENFPDGVVIWDAGVAFSDGTVIFRGDVVLSSRDEELLSVLAMRLDQPIYLLNRPDTEMASPAERLEQPVAVFYPDWRVEPDSWLERDADDVLRRRARA